jgi:hypothetical protein
LSLGRVRYTRVKSINSSTLPYRVVDVTGSSQGDLVIVEAWGKRAAILSRQGSVKLNLTVHKAHRLRAVARQANTLYIIDAGTGAIHMLLENNTYILSIHTKLSQVSALAITDSTIWVTTQFQGLHKLTIDSNFTVIKSDLLVPNSAMFDFPKSMTARDSRVVVACQESDNIHVFDACSSGAFEFPPMGGSGSGDGQLSLPYDVVTDLLGNIYVVDQENYRIVVFNNRGQFLTNLVTRKDSLDGQLVSLYIDFNILYIITVDPNKVYVIELE